jgi:hypothetical protein
MVGFIFHLFIFL